MPKGWFSSNPNVAAIIKVAEATTNEHHKKMLMDAADAYEKQLARSVKTNTHAVALTKKLNEIKNIVNS